MLYNFRVQLPENERRPKPSSPPPVFHRKYNFPTVIYSEIFFILQYVNCMYFYFNFGDVRWNNWDILNFLNSRISIRGWKFCQFFRDEKKLRHSEGHTERTVFCLLNFIFCSRFFIRISAYYIHVSYLLEARHPVACLVEGLVHAWWLVWGEIRLPTLQFLYREKGNSVEGLNPWQSVGTLLEGIVRTKS